MKSILDRFLVWWLRGARYRWSRFRRKLFEGRYLRADLPPVASLEDIQQRLGEVTWTMDGPLHLYDAISYPQKVWHRKKDDCDGFAVLAAALLRQWRPDSRPVLLTVMLRPVSRSHTVCAFPSPGDEIWYFDNSFLRQASLHTYTEIVNVVKGDAELVCWDVADPVTLETIEFHRAA